MIQGGAGCSEPTPGMMMSLSASQRKTRVAAARSGPLREST